MASKTMYIPLGSGHLYYTTFSGSSSTIPSDATIETETNRLGYIEGGAELEYSPEYTTLKDDLGLVSRTALTTEEAKFSCSLIGWSMHDFAVFASTARVDETTKSGHREIKIGGLDSDTQQSYLFRFVHKDPKYGDIRITIAGRQTAGFTLSYKKDEAGAMALEVTAEALDSTGTLILYDETISTAVGTNETSEERAVVDDTPTAEEAGTDTTTAAADTDTATEENETTPEYVTA
jgi:hypothetical protein